MKGRSGHDRSTIVTEFVRFQATGTGFEIAWTGMGPIVEDFARRTLQRFNVKVWSGHGESMVDDVVSQTKVRLFELGQPGANGRFDPAKAGTPGLSGLRGWLWRVVGRLAIDLIRDNGDIGDSRVLRESDLEWDDPSGDGDMDSILKRATARIERLPLLPILEEVIGQLSDPLTRKAVLLKLNEGLSQEATGRRLGVSDTTIHVRLHNAYDILRPLLEARGVDESWLAA